MPTITYADLLRVTQEIIEAAGTARENALGIGEALVEANLRGHDSHGVLRLPWYIQAIERGEISATALPEVIARRGATAQVDGKFGWGQLAARLATKTAIELAGEYNIGLVGIVRGQHIGRVGEYVETIANAGMIGIAFCNAGAAVAPYGGYERLLGTNPLAWAVPRGNGQPPMVLDFATSIVAEGKLRVTRSKGEMLAHDGLIYDTTGKPSIDPADFYEGGALRTFGLHKGSGLSVMIELLARGLCGVDPTLEGPNGHNGTLIIAFQIPAFAPTEQFESAVSRFQAQVDGMKPLEGVERVLMPGDPELISRENRLRDGIPLPQSLWDELSELAARYNVSFV